MRSIGDRLFELFIAREGATHRASAFSQGLDLVTGGHVIVSFHHQVPICLQVTIRHCSSIFPTNLLKHRDGRYRELGRSANRTTPVCLPNRVQRALCIRSFTDNLRTPERECKISKPPCDMLMRCSRKCQKRRSDGQKVQSHDYAINTRDRPTHIQRQR